MGTEIRTSLDFKWSKSGWVAYGPGYKWNLKSGSPTIGNLDKWLPFCQKPFETQTTPYDFEWSGFGLVGTIAITIAKGQPFQKVWISMFTDFNWSDFRTPL